MGAFTTWPSWPASGSATGGAAGAPGAGRASAGAGAVPRPSVAADAGAMLTAPPLTIFTFSSPSVISSSAMPDSCTRSISFFSLRRSIASSPPGGYSALGTCGGLQWIFRIFAGEGCILAQQPFENLLHLRSGKRAEPAMSDRTHPVNHDSIGQSAKGVSQSAHQLNRVRPGYQHGVGDAVGLCKFIDFSRLIDADTDNFRTFRGKDLPGRQPASGSLRGTEHTRLPRSCTLRRGPATPARCAWRRKGLETGPPADPPPHSGPAARAHRPAPRRQRPRHQSRRGSGLHVWLAPSRRSAPTSAIPARSITRPACEVFSASRSSRGSNTDRLSGAPRQSNESTLTACARSPEKRRHSCVVYARLLSSKNSSTSLALSGNNCNSISA